MPEPGLVDRQGLLAWASTAGARSELPRLIRRLILETTSAGVRVGMPADEGIQSGGWDGTVRSPETIRWVPEGLSLWELSTNAKASQKASSDYAKRLTTPDGSPTGEASYVALIPRPWTQRDEWARSQNEDGRWREVLAYGLDDVVTWLEAAPATHLWLSEHCGLNPFGRTTAETRWSNWATRTDPALAHEFVLAGRGHQADDLIERLAGKPTITTVSGASLDEVRAFVAAAAVRADASGEGRPLARMVFVDEFATWRSLISQQSPLVLVPMRTELADEVPGDTPHQIVVPLARSDADITVSELDAGKGARALEALGIPEEDADRLARLARRSLSALRRSLAVHPELRTPPWAETPPPPAVRAMLLAGHVADEREGDRQVLGDLAGEEYETVRDTLVNLSNLDDPLVCLVDGSWHLVSAEDAWLQLSQYLTPDDLQRLAAAVDEVLGETDPALELNPKDRWQAPVLGQTRRFSDDLRNGLAETVTLLGARGDRVRGPGGCTGAESATHLTGNLLGAANADETGRLWPSLSPLLPLLAEAAPDTFLEAVRELLRNDTLTEQFLGGDAGSDLFAATPARVGLLWALELLACSPDYLGAAADVLARLDPVTATDMYTSAPSDSLSRIFCIWHPETAATAQQRINVLDGLRQRHPDCAWPLLLSLLPRQGPLQVPIHRPKFMDWDPADQSVTDTELRTFVAEIVIRLIEDASTDERRWANLLQPLPFLSQPALDMLIQKLTGIADDDSLTEDTRAILWQQLSDLVESYRPRDDTERTKPTPILDNLERIAASLTPSAAIHRAHQLFSEFWPRLNGLSRDHDADSYDAALAEQRRDILMAIYRDHGLDVVRSLSTFEATIPRVVSDPLAEIGDSEIDAGLLPFLTSEAEHDDRLLALNYFTSRFIREAWQWLNEIFGNHILDNYQKARLLHASRDYPKSWELADCLGGDVATIYWRFVDPRLNATIESPHIGYATERLTAIGRFGAALLCVQFAATSGDLEPEFAANLSARILHEFQGAGFVDPEITGNWNFASHYIKEALTLVQGHRNTVGDDQVSRLEWAFLPVLDDIAPTVLHEQIAKDSSRFVEIIKSCYRPRNRDRELDRPPTQSEALLAQNCYKLLRSWRHVPGTRASGVIDPDELRRWITNARHLLEQADRLTVGDQHLGMALSYAPPDPDGCGIPQVVRDILEDVDSAAILQGVYIELLNRRGVTVRASTDGGAQERELAVDYRLLANRFADRWPATAQIYRDLADTYDRRARHEDEEAEREHRGISK